MFPLSLSPVVELYFTMPKVTLITKHLQYDYRFNFLSAAKSNGTWPKKQGNNSAPKFFFIESF